MVVMTFGVCCSLSSVQYVKNVNADHFRSEFPETCEAVTKSHYVADMLISVIRDEESLLIAKKFIMFKRGVALKSTTVLVVLENCGSITGTG